MAWATAAGYGRYVWDASLKGGAAIEWDDAAARQRFRALIADGVAALATWPTTAQTSDLAPFAALTNGIVADRAAVEAALTTPRSTGPVEGHVHRVKLLKRQHFGRAKLDLLRARVLAA